MATYVLTDGFHGHFFGTLRNSAHTREFMCGRDIDVWKMCRGLCGGKLTFGGNIHMCKNVQRTIHMRENVCEKDALKTFARKVWEKCV